MHICQSKERAIPKNEFPTEPSPGYKLGSPNGSRMISRINAAGEEGEMTDFEDREHGYEAKFRLDQELSFKAEARGAHMIGLWAAQRMGLAGPAAESYASATREAKLTRSGRDEVLRKLSADLTAAGIKASVEDVAIELDRANARARQEILEQVSSGATPVAPGV